MSGFITKCIRLNEVGGLLNKALAERDEPIYTVLAEFGRKKEATCIDHVEIVGDSDVRVDFSWSFRGCIQNDSLVIPLWLLDNPERYPGAGKELYLTVQAEKKEKKREEKRRMIEKLQSDLETD